MTISILRRRFLVDPLSSVYSLSEISSIFSRIAEMADRFYPNLMPDFVAENPAVEEEQHPTTQQGTDESLLKLLSTPYHILSEKFKRAALDLKETVKQLHLLPLYDRLTSITLLARFVIQLSVVLFHWIN